MVHPQRESEARPAPGSARSVDLQVTLPPPGRIGVEVACEDVLALGEAERRDLLGLVHRHKLLVFRGQQRLSDEQYIQLARSFGTPQIYFQPHYHHPEHPEIFVSANVPRNGQKFGVRGTGRYWHTDYQFFDEPLSTTMIRPMVLPQANRETYYIDMERVLAELPAALRERIEPRWCIHEAKMRYKVQAEDIDKSIAELLEEFGRVTPPVQHPAVLVHPVTGARCLYVSEGFTTGVEGMSTDEARELLGAIFAFTEREEHVHVHRWVEGDILFWDNRSLLHKASNVPSGQPSVSYRIGVYDGLPFFANRHR